MITHPPPMSNAERQRKFQAAHPGYDRRRKSRERGTYRRDSAQRLQTLHAQALALQQTQAAIRDFQLAPTRVLMLPAPVEPIVLPSLADVRARMQTSE